MRKSFSILWFLVCTLMVANAASYGIIVNGKRYFAGTKNPSPGDPSFEEYMVLGVPLKSGDVLALYDADNKASWAVTLDQSSTAGISKSGDQYSCSETGCYDFYIKLKYQSDRLYVGKGADGCSDWGQDVGDEPQPVGTGITVNVTVPAGTPACFFYGEMSDNTFAEMTKVDATHYTTTFPHATTIGWGYVFAWENGNWNTKNADPEGDIKVEPVNGVIDVEVKAWVTNPGTEYKYTTYTEWQVKYGPDWEWVNMTKQEEGVFAVNAVWGNTGINIASGENPIKQDWYPLDDDALTVEQGVAEGDNVVITLTVIDDETIALNVTKAEPITEPTVTEIAITGDKYVGTELTFAATVAGFSADPQIIYEVKAAEGEYEQAQGGKFTPAAAGNYTVKATAFYLPEEGDTEEAFKEVEFTVTEKPVKEYYLLGDYCGWKHDTTAVKMFAMVNDTLTVTIDSLYGGVKITEGKSWDINYGAYYGHETDSYTLALGQAYGLYLNNSEDEKGAKNFTFDADYTDAVFQLYTNQEDGKLTLKFVSGTKVEQPQSYYLKNNWNGATEWSWKAMKAAEEGYVLDSVIFGGTGVNLNTKEDDANAVWFGMDKLKYNETDTIQALDTVRFELAISKEDTVLIAILLGRPEPAARKEFVFVADAAADGNPTMFAITWGKDGSNETVKMAKKGEEALYTADVLETVDSVVLVRCATDAASIIWDGEGKNVWNQTDNYEMCDTMKFVAWVDGSNRFTIACNTPKPVETKYYAKNNWDKAAEWSWLEMSATNVENVYMLDSVVFGGTGVNINDKADDTDALYFAVDKISVLNGLDGLPFPYIPEPRKHDTVLYAPARLSAVLGAPTLQAGDTIKLFFNASDSKLSALIIGRPEPVETKYYITGNAALVGEELAWNEQAIEMNNGTYTFTQLAAGDYEMKITNGAWEPEGQSWGSAALSENCSAGVGDKDGNIHFIVETPNEVTVSIAEGKVTVIGTFKEEPVGTGITVNVTVPAGTPACFFYGEMSGNTFVEMTKVDDTHYTTTFPHATTIGWGYVFAWENGNWNTKNADPEGDITIEPVNGVIDVEVKAWVTNPGTEYKYTTYTEWQVKYGPDWEWVNMTKQEEGVFAVNAVWGNTGINIASGENPIKQDWYPLDDDALTVEQGVAEGDNVVITLTVVDDETVALNVAKGEGPTPVDEGFGIILGDGSTIKGHKNEEQTEFLEYLIEANLTAGATFQLYDFANKASWTEDNIDEASTPNVTINTDHVYEAAANGKYTIYLKMYGLGDNQVYIAYEEPTGLIEIMRNAKDGKFIINGNMIIRRNGALYTIQGARL